MLVDAGFSVTVIIPYDWRDFAKIYYITNVTYKAAFTKCDSCGFV